MTIVAPETEISDVVPEPLRRRVTVAHGVLFLISVAAAIGRLPALDALPLSPVEAERALAVWRFWQPGPVTPNFDVSPAYFTLTALLLPMIGDSDLAMRLVPALVGIALVLVPWLWRDRLGLLGALTTGILLAASPMTNLIALTVGGDAIALVATLLLLIMWIRYQDSGQSRWLIATFVALGLGLSSSPLFYSGLATLALAWLVQTKLGPAFTHTPSLDGRTPERTSLLRALLAGTAVFVGLATLFLSRPAGFGAAATQLAQWLGYFQLPSTPTSHLAPFLVLGRYELIAITLGALAIFWASWRGAPLPIFLVYWFAAGLILMLVQPEMRANLLTVVLPAYLLLGLWLDDIFRRRANLLTAGVFGALLLLGAVAYMNVARFLRLYFSGRGDSGNGFLLLAVLTVIIGVVVLNYVYTWDKGATYQGALTAVLVLFLVYNWGTARWLTQEGANDPRAHWAAPGTDDDVRMLVEMLEEISWQITGSRYDLRIASSIDHPVIQWYLRHFYRAQIGNTLPPSAQQPAIITPLQENPVLGDDYFGTDLNFIQTGPVRPRSSGDFRHSTLETLRWWLFHEHPQPIERQKIMLWVRSDALQ